MCFGVVFVYFWCVDVWLILFALALILFLHFALRLPQLEEEVCVDAKTGLANARHFMEELTEELTRARRFGRPLLVIVADLDLLRNINNIYGYLAGDVVLVGVVQILSSYVRHYDVAVRFGGGGFVIVLPKTTEHET